MVGLGQGALIRRQPPDFNLEIAERDIQPDDIEMLTRELNLKETTPTTLDALVSEFGRDDWFDAFREMKSGAMIEDEDGKKIPLPTAWPPGPTTPASTSWPPKACTASWAASSTCPTSSSDPPPTASARSSRPWKPGSTWCCPSASIESDLDYLLVSQPAHPQHPRSLGDNAPTSSAAQGEKEPRPLVIVVEEAHKLLNREMAAQTTFSTIAREMRKYYVTLLIIDQRPSQIYDEVMSQLGTRISGWLGDEDDIQAVLSGLAGGMRCAACWRACSPRRRCCCWVGACPCPCRCARAATTSTSGRSCSENQAASLARRPSWASWDTEPAHNIRCCPA